MAGKSKVKRGQSNPLNDTQVCLTSICEGGEKSL